MIHSIVQEIVQNLVHKSMIIRTKTQPLNKRVRLEGKFVSKNVINLSRRNLTPPEISLSSEGLKFVSSASKIDWVI